jgi:dolichol-phosphate mannosyltransferase
LPAYEEADNLQILLPHLKRVASSLCSSFEILVIDAEFPRDNTMDVCKKNDVCYAPRTGGSHYGDAIRTAVRLVKGDHVIFMDADGSHDPDFIPQLWEFRKQYDLVIASRYVSGGKTENPFILIFMSLIVNLVFRFTLNLKCWDVSNSFRLYNGEQVRQLKLECSDFDIVEEILVKLRPSHGPLRIKEVPFTFRKRNAGKTKRNLVLFTAGYLKTLFKLYQIKHKADVETQKKEVA